MMRMLAHITDCLNVSPSSVCLEPVTGDGEAGDEEPECMEAATLPSSPSTVTQVCRYVHRYVDIIYIYRDPGV